MGLQAGAPTTCARQRAHALARTHARTRAHMWTERERERERESVDKRESGGGGFSLSKCERAREMYACTCQSPRSGNDDTALYSLMACPLNPARAGSS
jgi:hypothetical protein